MTFTNSGVNSFRARIDRILREHYCVVSYIGYRVRTLHGLAHDIVRERPALVGLADDFTILDERTTLDIQRDIVLQHLAPIGRCSGVWQASGRDQPENGALPLSGRPTRLMLSYIKREDLRLTPEMLDVPLRRAGSSTIWRGSPMRSMPTTSAASPIAARSI